MRSPIAPSDPLVTTAAPSDTPGAPLGPASEYPLGNRVLTWAVRQATGALATLPSPLGRWRWYVAKAVLRRASRRGRLGRETGAALVIQRALQQTTTAPVAGMRVAHWLFELLLTEHVIPSDIALAHTLARVAPVAGQPTVATVFRAWAARIATHPTATPAVYRALLAVQPRLGPLWQRVADNVAFRRDPVLWAGFVADRTVGRAADGTAFTDNVRRLVKTCAGATDRATLLAAWQDLARLDLPAATGVLTDRATELALAPDDVLPLATADARETRLYAVLLLSEIERLDAAGEPEHAVLTPDATTEEPGRGHAIRADAESPARAGPVADDTRSPDQRGPSAP